MMTYHFPSFLRTVSIGVVMMTFAACTSTEDGQIVECQTGDTQRVACGQYDQGVQEQFCEEYQWVDDGRCYDPTECFNGETRTQTQSCGFNEQGTLSQRCDDGLWTPYNDAKEEICSPQDIEEGCGCDDVDECLNGEEKTSACGLEETGEQAWICTDGQWAADGACEGAWACEDDGQEGMMPCGLNGRGEQPAICVDHEWIPHHSVDGRSVYHDESDAIGEDELCVDPDICVDGEEGGEAACGLENSGTQAATCTEGAWVGIEDAECKNAWECLPDDTREEPNACGRNMRGTRIYTCAEDHLWNGHYCEDPDACTDGAHDERECDTYGENNLPQTHHKTCENGQWSAWGDCQDSDRCRAEDSGDFTCGSADNRTGTEYRSCEDGYWNNSDCWQSATRLYAAPYSTLIAVDDILLTLGDNRYETAGNSDLTDDHYANPTPTHVVDPQGNPAHYAASTTHQCVINDNQDVRCWGQNGSGQLGSAVSTASKGDPTTVTLPEPAEQIAVGEGFSCALLSDQSVHCWGLNDVHQLGRPTSDASDPTPAPAFEGGEMLVAGDAHVCVVKNQEVFCWGANDAHQASEDDAQVIEEPTLHASLSKDPGLELEPPKHTDMCTGRLDDSTLLSISAGKGHTVVAWRTAWTEREFGLAVVVPFCVNGDVTRYTHLIGVGRNNHGQLTEDIGTDVAQARVLHRIDDRMDLFTPYAQGDATCVAHEKDDDWALVCTGANQEGQFTDDAQDLDAFTPIEAELGDGETIRDIALGYESLCVGLQETGRIRCRGGNTYGQLGDGSTQGRANADFVLHEDNAAP